MQFMTVREAADYLRVNKRTIYRLLERGGIPATRVGGQWRLSKAAIDEWLIRKSIGRKVSILVIDDEEAIRRLFEVTLSDLGHEVASARSGPEGLKLIERQDFSLVFLDLKMPGLNGADVLQRIRTIRPELPAVLITGYPDSDVMARAIAQGPFGVMKKPFGEADIVEAVGMFLRREQPS